MLFTTLHQDQAVWAALFAGVLLGGVYDILTAVRVLLRQGMLVTVAADLVMGTVAGMAALWTLYRANEGELRMILLAGMALGAAVYRLGIGRVLRGAYGRTRKTQCIGDGKKREKNE